jgi:glutamate--cysteine ligase
MANRSRSINPGSATSAGRPLRASATVALVPRLVARLRRDCFSPSVAFGPARIGAEVELIPVDAVSHRRCPIIATRESAAKGSPATLPVLRRLAIYQGWHEHASPYGAPIYRMPDGGTISYEPGGQIEYSAPPAVSVSTLVARLRGMVALLRQAAGDAGIELLAVGIDPYNSVSHVPLELSGTRYVLMDAYFSELGPAGARMMRQTAATQVTVDGGEDPVALWHILSATAPYLTAVFANSARYAGGWSGDRSARAQAWRQLDYMRTGLPAASSIDPAADYSAFALRAPAILLPGRDGTYRPFHTLLSSGEAGEADWAPHLTTLFPEIRPRRLGEVATFEVRSADALEPDWYAAPLVMLAGLSYDRDARRVAASLLGPASPEILDRAGHLGLGDPIVAARAAELYALGLRGAARLGSDVVGGEELETAREFGAQYVFRGRSPADDALETARRVAERHRVGEVPATARG